MCRAEDAAVELEEPIGVAGEHGNVVDAAQEHDSSLARHVMSDSRTPTERGGSRSREPPRIELLRWWRGRDLNPPPSGYERDRAALLWSRLLPCSTTDRPARENALPSAPVLSRPALRDTAEHMADVAMQSALPLGVAVRTGGCTEETPLSSLGPANAYDEVSRTGTSGKAL